MRFINCRLFTSHITSTTLALLWASVSFAQERFSIRQYMHDGAGAFSSVYEDTQGNFHVLGWDFSSYAQVGIPKYVFNAAGELQDSVWWNDFDDLYSCPWSGRDLETGGGVSFGLGFVDDESLGQLIRYNAESSLVEGYLFQRPPQTVQNYGTITSANFYQNGEIVIGWRLVNEDGLDDFGLVQKFDPSGEVEQWSKIYDGPNDERVHQLKVDDDDLYVFLGELIGSGTNVWIEKLDSDGGLIWSLHEDNINMELVRIADAVCEEQSLLLLHHERISLTFRPRITKLDLTNDSVEWSLELADAFNDFNEGIKIILSTDGNGYIVASNNRITFDEYDEEEGYDNEYVRLTKVLPNGEIEWQRDHAHILSVAESHRASDLKACMDDGYVMAGTTVSTEYYNQFGEPAQQGWLLKVDEYGCLVENCHLSINEQKPEAIEYFLVGPNPASIAQGSLNIYLKDLAYNPNRHFEVRDLQGKLVESFKAPQGSTTYMVDVHNWQAGAYVVSFLEDGKVLDAKRVVVQ